LFFYAAKQKAKEVMVMRNKKKVLMVDDDKMHLYTSKELLQNERIEVVTHSSGFGVTNLVRELQPDLVLLDVNTPALSGDRLAQLLHFDSDTRHVPVVFYSSNDEDSLRDIVNTYGVRGYICKGNIAELRKKVDLYLNMPVLEESLAPGTREW
jgi:CheY-like chemotaxis protein